MDMEINRNCDDVSEGAFVLSIGRSGSTLLSSILKCHPDILSISEFFTVLGGSRAFFNRDLDSKQFANHLLARQPEADSLLSAASFEELICVDRADESTLCSSLLMLVPLPFMTRNPEKLLERVLANVATWPLAPICSHYDSLFRYLCRDVGARMWIERSGGSLAYASALLNGWPRARFIHLWRNGTDCALSMSKHAYFRLLVAKTEARDDALPASRALSMHIDIQRFGVYWSAITITGSFILASIPKERVFHINYDDLINDPTRQIDAIYRFLGADPRLSVVNEAASLVRPNAGHRRVARSEEIAKLERACRPGMRSIENLIRNQ